MVSFSMSNAASKLVRALSHMCLQLYDDRLWLKLEPALCLKARSDSFLGGVHAHFGDDAILTLHMKHISSQGTMYGSVWEHGMAVSIIVDCKKARDHAGGGGGQHFLAPGRVSGVTKVRLVSVKLGDVDRKG